MDAQMLHAKANEAAQQAVDTLIEKYGESSGHFGYAGFAWVKITPARGKFVAFLKANNLGNRSYNGGFEVRPDINYPAGSTAWQSMDLREAAAQAYAQVLKDAGITAYMQSRAD